MRSVACGMRFKADARTHACVQGVRMAGGQKYSTWAQHVQCLVVAERYAHEYTAVRFISR
eukprot:366178-Chlamydomonas_euryale.AAC.17